MRRKTPARSWAAYPEWALSPRQQAAVAHFNQKLAAGSVYRVVAVDCLLCGAAAAEILFTNDRYGIRQPTVMCRECGLVYSSPRMTAESTEAFYASDTYRLLYDDKPLDDVFIERCRLADLYHPQDFDASRYRPFMYIDFL